MILGKSNIELVDITEKIGDSLMFSALPENYYETFGKKLIHTQDHWTFKHNPYIDRQSKSEFQINPHEFVSRFDEKNYFGSGLLKNNNKIFSITERVALAFGAQCYVRTPRLYQFENIEIDKNLITLHTQAISQYAPFPNKIIQHIIDKYSTENKICQIGGLENIKIESDKINDLRGLNKWDVTKLIAQSRIFIGVNSGLIHIANCFPNVWKKVLLLNDDENSIFSKGITGEWIDYNWSYYCRYEYDKGVTNSYLKI